MAQDTPLRDSQPENTPTAPEKSAAEDSSGSGTTSGTQPLPEDAQDKIVQAALNETGQNDQVRYQYWQSEAMKAHRKVEELEGQLSRYVPEDERERFRQAATLRNYQDQLIETQLTTGYWTQQYPELKHLSKTRLESVVRAAYSAHPDNPVAVRETIAQTAAGAREIAQSLEKELRPKAATSDHPAQASVTPKPDMDTLSTEEVKRQVSKMSLDDLKKVWGRVREKYRQ